MHGEHVAHEETDKATGITLRIIQDSEGGFDPTEGDDAIIMAVLHRRYHNPAQSLTLPRDDSADSKGADEEDKGTTYTFKDRTSLALFELEQCRPTGEWEAFPLYLYDHSGTCYQVAQEGQGNPFLCKWDSGRVGTLFVKRSDVGPDGTFKAAQAACRDYTSWANGEIYGYTVTDSEGNSLDSCWGFIGDSDGDVLDEARAAFLYEIAAQKVEDAKREAKEARAEKERQEKAAQDEADIATVRRYFDSFASTGPYREAFDRLHPQVKP